MEITKLNRGISLSLFLVTFSVTLISVIPVVFPALVLRSFGGFKDNAAINPFEMGVWSIPFLIINFIIFAIMILYLKNKLPQSIRKPFNVLSNFEISPQIAFLTITILIGIYITLHVDELFNNEFDPDYYNISKAWLASFTITHFHDPTGLNDDVGHYLQLLFEVYSMKFLGNYKVVPFLSSIILLILTYLVTAKLSKKRFAGVIATAILLQSGVFLFYDTSVSYTTLWMIFYLISIYLVYTKWFLSPLAFFAGIFSKGLVVIFFPITLLFIYRSEISNKTKLYLTISYFITLAFLFVLLSITQTHLNPVGQTTFSLHGFWSGLDAFYSSFLLDGLVLLFMPALIAGLYLATRKNVIHSDFVMFFIMAMLFSGPALAAFTDNQNTPYRYVSLVVFFAIGVGLLLSKKISERS